MYKLVLISKYLRRKLAPLFAALAVTICTAMVVIVISVMGGFLDLMRTTAKTLTGDVIVEAQSLTGFAHYEQLIENVEALPEVELATPMVQTFALLKLYEQTAMIQVRGIDPEKMSRIVSYEDTLLWTGDDYADYRTDGLSDPARDRVARDIDLHRAGMTLTTPTLMQVRASQQLRDRLRDAFVASADLRRALAKSPAFDPAYFGDPPDTEAFLLRVLQQPYGYVLLAEMIVEDPTLLDLPGIPTIRPEPGAVIGIEVNPYQRRDENGEYHYADPLTGGVRSFVGEPIDLTFAPLSPSGEIGVFEPVRQRITVVNEFKSGYIENDSSVVYVPIDWLQQQLQMQRSEDFDASTIDPVTGLGGEAVVTPGRVHQVWIKAADGYTADQAAAAVQDAVTALMRDYPDLQYLHTRTWEQEHAQLLGAVQNEKGLVTFLFAIISIVAILMVSTTFYMIVLEKTRDIGVLRAIGAPATGILNLFLAYGLVIGVIGACSGVALAWFTVTNLNNLQNALAVRLGTLIGSVTLTFIFALIFAIVLTQLLRRRDFGLGGGAMVFIAVWVGLLAILYYTFPMVTVPFASGLDDQIGWRMWDPQTYFFDQIPDRVNPTEAISIGIGAVVSSVLGAVVPALIAARLNPVEALRYE